MSYVSDAAVRDDHLWLLLNTPGDEPSILVVFTPNGSQSQRIVLGDLAGARAMAFDESGEHLYVTVPDEATVLGYVVRTVSE